MKKHIFIIGSRGLPAKYGGFETFVEELVKHQSNQNIKYHVACQSENSDIEVVDGHFDYRGADCFVINVPNIGPARVIAYDALAINAALKQIKEEQIIEPVFYILGNTIGGIIGHYAHKIHKVGGKLLVNPDGLEWKRTKWPKPVRRYLKHAEKKMVRSADMIISDNQGILDYLRAEYGQVKSEVIAYGTETEISSLDFSTTLEEFGVEDYYLIVGRFVPENNYETLIRSFMASNTENDLVIITNYEGNTFYDILLQKTQFDQDRRIKFVGTVYDQDELRYIREHALAYLHGHEVGGTNPGLLEAMWSTSVNLVLDVNFNRETAGDAVLYFNKDELTQKINQIENLSDIERNDLQNKSRSRIQERYMWDMICTQYEELFVES
ncbi:MULTISPECIES: beta 1-4 rhamnosyltransferase Cps2T [Lactococcus]|uniref:beta 1-4 rhamnosyltransferase Cps2T n=1 Tax=Lactococcus TaxID=1357 RepID=UPI00156EC15F|nr:MULTISPECIES: glycosyltransferase family 1 protein [Lactococcus]NSL25686.1 glycosyltransferase family 1 protein [Lactococcus petauri]QSR04584.1 glycosyltransferase family 1 protein [Lactococcus sp. LG1267]